jgi:hypothetical protein
MRTTIGWQDAHLKRTVFAALAYVRYWHVASIFECPQAGNNGHGEAALYRVETTGGWLIQ